MTGFQPIEIDMRALLAELLEKATPVHPAWNLRVKDNGEERYELIGDPCGFPVATFGDASDATLDLVCRTALPSILDSLQRFEAALERIRDHDGVSYRFGDEVREIARAALLPKE